MRPPRPRAIQQEPAAPPNPKDRKLCASCGFSSAPSTLCCENPKCGAVLNTELGARRRKPPTPFIHTEPFNNQAFVPATKTPETRFDLPDATQTDADVAHELGSKTFGSKRLKTAGWSRLSLLARPSRSQQRAKRSSMQVAAAVTAGDVASVTARSAKPVTAVKERRHSLWPTDKVQRATKGALCAYCLQQQRKQINWKEKRVFSKSVSAAALLCFSVAVMSE